MIVPLQFLVISGYLALSLSEYVDHTNYYPDYGYVYNNTIPTYNKRIFTDDYSIGMYVISICTVFGPIIFLPQL